jgi:hypothetical protein
LKSYFSETLGCCWEWNFLVINLEPFVLYKALFDSNFIQVHTHLFVNNKNYKFVTELVANELQLVVKDDPLQKQFENYLYFIK